MHVVVEGDGLRTQFAYAPKVSLEAAQDGPMTVKMRFASSVIGADKRVSVTTLTFANVLDFRWSDFELGLAIPNPDDTGFRLIEVVDSGTIEEFLREGKLRQRRRGLIKEEDLRHFRIAFDDHGTYDVVCTDVSSVVVGESVEA